MRTELSKPFTHGFMLTEQELRRIHDTMVQQMKRDGRDVFSSLYELKYKNGGRAEKASLDDVIADTNNGEWIIQGLRMALLSKRFQPQETQIEIEFRVPPPPPTKEVTQRPFSIRYHVIGNERDWVYVVSSLLDERIAIIKRLPINEYGLFAIVIGIITLALFLVSFAPTSSIQLSLGGKIVGTIVSSLITIGGCAAVYGFPLYTFYWGDQVKYLARRQAVGKYILNGVVVALILSIIGSIIATLFFLK
jgi:hypothetical protein